MYPAQNAIQISKVRRDDVIGPGSDGAASQQGRPATGVVQEEEGVEDRKENTISEIEEQQTFILGLSGEGLRCLIGPG